MNSTASTSKKIIIASLSLLVAFTTLSGCANKTPGAPLQASTSSFENLSNRQEDVASNHKALDNKDYIEPVNRAIYQFNDVVDGVLIKPMAHIYLGLMPEFGQRMVRNMLVNLDAPVVFLNSVLQNDPRNAGTTLGRFVVNSTLGIAGAFDVATHLGIGKSHKKDFGQTLGVYGVGSGAYVELPLIGPSDVRDAFGYAVDIFTDPFNYIFTTDEAFARSMTQGLVRRTDYLPLTERVKRDSFDPYATFRSIYLQNRHRVVRDYLGSDSDVEKYSGK